MFMWLRCHTSMHDHDVRTQSHMDDFVCTTAARSLRSFIEHFGCSQVLHGFAITAVQITTMSAHRHAHSVRLHSGYTITTIVHIALRLVPCSCGFAVIGACTTAKSHTITYGRLCLHDGSTIAAIIHRALRLWPGFTWLRYHGRTDNHDVCAQTCARCLLA